MALAAIALLSGGKVWHNAQAIPQVAFPASITPTLEQIDWLITDKARLRQMNWQIQCPLHIQAHVSAISDGQQAFKPLSRKIILAALFPVLHHTPQELPKVGLTWGRVPWAVNKFVFNPEALSHPTGLLRQKACQWDTLQASRRDQAGKNAFLQKLQQSLTSGSRLQSAIAQLCLTENRHDATEFFCKDATLRSMLREPSTDDSQ
jgi:hypothetical protein